MMKSLVAILLAALTAIVGVETGTSETDTIRVCIEADLSSGNVTVYNVNEKFEIEDEILSETVESYSHSETISSTDKTEIDNKKDNSSFKLGLVPWWNSNNNEETVNSTDKTEIDNKKDNSSFKLGLVPWWNSNNNEETVNDK